MMACTNVNESLPMDYDENMPTQNDLNIISTKVNDLVIIQKVKAYVDEDVKNKAVKGLSLDYNSMMRVKREGFYGEAIVALQSEKQKAGNSASQVAFLLKDNEVIGSMIIKMELTDNQILKIGYYTADEKLIEQVTLNSNTNSISFAKNKIMAKACGQDTVDCIDTMYSELGWGSVSWWVGTAIFGWPWAAGTILGCAYAACIQ